MGYVAVKGGTLAIEESLKRIKYERLKGGTVLDVRRIEGGMRALVDQVMSESSLYSETLAALALKQAEGSPEEAVFLLRAYRSTLPRKHYSRVAKTSEMRVERRISASFKDIPGGQILGATVDYSHRLLDFDLMDETDEEAAEWVRGFQEELKDQPPAAGEAELMKVVDYLIRQGLMVRREDDDTEPDDVTRRSVTFPASRSQKLQILTRGQTGAVTSLAYAVIRGYGVSHPTVGELRVGHMPVSIDDPLGMEGDEDDSYYIGEIKVTEAEMLMSASASKEQGRKELAFEIGYGLCYGQNETKAIAMGILDHSLEQGDGSLPTQNHEFVLFHIDSVESTGFMSHLKLPHYVTFQSKMNDVRKTKGTVKPEETAAEKTGEVQEACT
ncbi:carbon-phosphorus lyase complex subunit PhnI [Paenibacillus azoreducens]|uniref:Carbon-phosphorus lyase complex subunit PhnI n=1 Tax=Paenibacillus azoreducens TaxID=116718 RepID=A0A919YMF2_9BACL|nr:carbon-phosphorus lyase complex subunit PhnI [Paenibacillus azoreducens]GIO51285.1 carbon-phosphorus lyase complex subunit PhnI [Paenibacillus azoreducens]